MSGRGLFGNIRIFIAITMNDALFYCKNPLQHNYNNMIYCNVCTLQTALKYIVPAIIL